MFIKGLLASWLLLCFFCINKAWSADESAVHMKPDGNQIQISNLARLSDQITEKVHSLNNASVESRRLNILPEVIRKSALLKTTNNTGL